MGSPLGLFLANLFLAKIERGPVWHLIKSLGNYRRCMDDTFIVCDSNTDQKHLPNKCNNAHPSLKFTSEIEQNDKLPFLDVLLRRREHGTLERTIFRETTWVGQYTHFLSFIPTRCERNLVHCLYYRATRICSPETLKTEKNFILKTLESNGYPTAFNWKHSVFRPESES